MRVVSLVPSLTEAVAVTPPGLLVGVTDWCSHPAGLDAVRVKGTKNPDVARIIELAPDLVIANEEENRPADLDGAHRRRASTVLVTEVRHAAAGPSPSWSGSWSNGCGLTRPGLAGRRRAGLGRCAVPGPEHMAVVPIWRRPWMVLGRDTFAGDLLARLGVHNVYAAHAERYPRIAARG